MSDIFGGMGDIFSSFFGGMGGRGSQQVRRDGRDMGIGLRLTLEEVARGAKKDIVYDRLATCGGMRWQRCRRGRFGGRMSDLPRLGSCRERAAYVPRRHADGGHLPGLRWYRTHHRQALSRMPGVRGAFPIASISPSRFPSAYTMGSRFASKVVARRVCRVHRRAI